MLAPKRVKFRKRFKGRTSGMATRGNTVAFGHYGLMSLEPGWISNRQLKTDELSQKLAVLTEEQFRLEFRRATESLSNPLQLRTIRRDIARIKTILKERASA